MGAPDEGITTGPAFRERRTITNWHRVGKITFDEAVPHTTATMSRISIIPPGATTRTIRQRRRA